MKYIIHLPVVKQGSPREAALKFMATKPHRRERRRDDKVCQCQTSDDVSNFSLRERFERFSRNS